ncbi:hypothetical protein R1flu_026733 [Riccia fluitans]|uniref:F-box domain-containing protein n=1 Tax=Riccia fluitans TaxID=41844 RepID=A0ABD1XGU7_9MARC
MLRRRNDCTSQDRKLNLREEMLLEDGREEDAMDPSLWGQLPHEILLAILAWLPLRTLARMRVVSKSWSAMWYCPVFMQFRSRITPPERFFLLFKTHGVQWFASRTPQVWLYDPSLNKLHSKLFKHFPSSYSYQVLATARGLLLCGKRPPRIYSFTSFWPEKDNESLNMIVCNPLRENCAVALPERIGTWRPCVVGMIGGEGNTYKVILASFMYGTEIYDLCSRRWKLIPKSGVRNGPLPPGFNPSVISRKGCMLYIGRSLSGDAAAVFLFNGETEQWSSFDLPVSGVGLQYLQLQDCGGRLFLIGHMKALTECRNFLCFGDVFVWERVGEDVVKGAWEARFSPHPQNESHFPVLSSPEGMAFLARSKTEDIFCYTKATFGAAEHDNSIEHLSLYNVSSNSWWSCAEGRVCTHDFSKSRRRTSGGAGVTYRCDFVFEPRIEALP